MKELRAFGGGFRGKAIVAAGMVATIVGGAAAIAAEGPSSASAYINRDTGAATENSNVNEDSDCASPDRRDRQMLSPQGEATSNVHVDACLTDSEGEPFDGVVTFASRGAGAISACPDPDQVVAQVSQVMNGPKVAYVHDHDGDGSNDHCHQTGYQAKDAAGDEEYHVRVNNDSKAGRQRVVFCYDPQQDAGADAAGQPRGHGCSDSEVKSRVTIRWTE